MKSETKAAYIKFLELHLAELKESPESTTINVPSNHSWGGPTSTATTECELEFLKAVRIPLENINPADLNLPQEKFNAGPFSVDYSPSPWIDSEIKTTSIPAINMEKTFWEKSQREGLEKMKNLSVELPSNCIERKREFEENEVAKKLSTPIDLEPYIGTVIQLTEEQKESLKNSVIPDEVPDSEFILPQGNVKKIVKKKK